MIIDVPRMKISFKAFETGLVLRYVKYHLAKEIDEWTFDLAGTGEMIGREVLKLGPLPGIPDAALTEKGRKQERELNKLLEV